MYNKLDCSTQQRSHIEVLTAILDLLQSEEYELGDVFHVVLWQSGEHHGRLLGQRQLQSTSHNSHECNIHIPYIVQRKDSEGQWCVMEVHAPAVGLDQLEQVLRHGAVVDDAAPQQLLIHQPGVGAHLRLLQPL